MPVVAPGFRVRVKDEGPQIVAWVVEEPDLGTNLSRQLRYLYVEILLRHVPARIVVDGDEQLFAHRVRVLREHAAAGDHDGADADVGPRGQVREGLRNAVAPDLSAHRAVADDVSGRILPEQRELTDANLPGDCDDAARRSGGLEGPGERIVGRDGILRERQAWSRFAGCRAERERRVGDG